MSGFADLGLSEPLLAAADAAGFEAPGALQRGSIPVIRRGGNAVLTASSGAGTTAAWALGVLDRLGAEGAGDGLRALVLVPTEARAGRVAAAVAPFARAAGVPLSARAPGWPAAARGLLVATPPAVRAAMERSALKLEGIEAVVLVDLPALLAAAGEEDVAGIIAALPRDAQRVFVTPEGSAAVDRFVEAHARRALHVPPRAADPDGAPAPPPATRRLRYHVVAADAKDDVLAGLLAESPRAVLVRSGRRREELRGWLADRGFEETADGIRLVTPADAEGQARILLDLPLDTDGFIQSVANDAVAIASTAELPHLRRLAAAAGFGLDAQPDAAPRAAEALEPFRDRIRAALEEEDLDAQLLVLEPLLRERPAAQVAAALSALLRARTPAAPAPAADADARTGARPDVGGMTRLFISIGNRDNVRPGDLVGAITGEAGVSGDDVGRIELRDTFSTVEVATGVAEKVIRALNGTTMRGRSLRVDFDRHVSESRGPRPGGDRAPRGGARGGGGAGRPPGRGGPPRGPSPRRER
jgi:ATP-dependent RNA helicase DeaD